IGHVHRVVDVSNVLRRCENSIAQNRLTDKPSIDKVVVVGTDIKIDVYASANRLSLINNSRTTRRKRRPPDVVATGSPGNPGRSPIKIFARKPNPAVVGQTGPAPIMISRPPEIFLEDPRHAFIVVSPVTISIRPPMRFIHRFVGLPAVAVVS